VIPPEEPKLFLKSPQAVIPGGEPILYPGRITRLTCEVSWPW
jgi:2-keto-4-pentenoate hydratase/2-oxohepta-3-ene-1,7-dioic acid hydratase in catechol pathway